MAGSKDNGSKRISFIKAATGAMVITILTIAVAQILTGAMTSLEAFTPREKMNDFSFSDFYTLSASNANAVIPDSNITIVALDGCTRAQMGHAIATIDSCHASVIGIDLIFNPPTTTPDDPVIAAIDSLANIVLPVILKDPAGHCSTAAEASYFEPMLVNEHEHGAVNINGTFENSTTRYFKAEFETIHGPVPSIATIISDIYDPGAGSELLERDKDIEMINYSSRVFNILKPQELSANADLLRGKIVLIGYIDDAADMHRTPLVNRMPGILIHANTIATILGREYIELSPRWLTYMVALTACYMMVLARFFLRRYKWGAMLVRLIQTGLLIGVLYLGAIVFIRNNYSFDFTPTIKLTILGIVMMDFSTGLAFIGQRIAHHTHRLYRKAFPKPKKKDIKLLPITSTSSK